MRLVAHRLGKTYRQADGPVVRGIDLEVPDGAFLALMGRSGSGKSTLLGMLAGTVRPTAGTVSYDGADLWALSDSRRSRLRATRTATVFQDYNLLEELSAAENIRLGAKLARRPLTREEADAALERVGLAGLGSKRPDELSGGQRQRVAIARALALNPDIIVADEPTSALDVSVRAQVLNLLQDLKAALGLGLVFISHDINTVRHVSDRIAVMYLGRILETGPTEEIFARPRQDYTRTLLGAVPSLLGA